MPKPVPDSPEDQALWARAERLAQELLDDREGAVGEALDDAYCHKSALAKGEAADSEFSERLFAEAQRDIELGNELAERVWRVLHAWIFAK